MKGKRTQTHYSKIEFKKILEQSSLKSCRKHLAEDICKDSHVSLEMIAGSPIYYHMK
jgi:hypothetical protein